MAVGLGTVIILGTALFMAASSRKKPKPPNGGGAGEGAGAVEPDMVMVCDRDLAALWGEPSVASAGLPLKPGVGEKWEAAVRDAMDSFVTMVDEGIEPGSARAHLWLAFAEEKLRELFPECDMALVKDIDREAVSPKAYDVGVALDTIAGLVFQEYIERYPQLEELFGMPGGGGAGAQPEWTEDDDSTWTPPEPDLPGVLPGGAGSGGGGGGGITPSNPPRPDEYDYAEGRHRTFEWSVVSRSQGGVIVGYSWAVPALNRQGNTVTKSAAVQAARNAIDAYLALPAGYGGVPGATKPVGTACPTGSWYNAEQQSCWPNKYKCPAGMYYNFDSETCRPIGY